MKKIYLFFKTIFSKLFSDNLPLVVVPAPTKKDEHDQLIKLRLREYFDHYDVNWYQMQIHLIEVKTEIDKIQVTITLGRPGYIIGKGGILYDDIKKTLNQYMKIPVEIELKEFNIWA